MELPTFGMSDMLEAGLHFGHTTRRWNPKMEQYIYGERNGTHILDLRQSYPMMQRAMQEMRNTAAAGGRILFVGTKRQAQSIIAESATACGQYYINHRWLGGTLTNWGTISNSIRRIKEIEEKLENTHGMTKRELLSLERHLEKLNRAIGGIRQMGNIPNLIFVLDVNRDATAVKEAKLLNIPVIGILDSNSNPEDIAFPIPGNDDAIRAIRFYCDLFSRSILQGLQQSLNDGDVAEDMVAKANTQDAPVEEDKASEVAVESPEEAQSSDDEKGEETNE